jgi:hypothetical protein
MKNRYTAEMAACAMMYIPSFIRTDLDTQNSIRGIDIHRQHVGFISLILFLNVRKVG